MASRSVSPGGALLRASRVFSIPPPLPRPSGDLSSTAIFNSNTASLPHPIQLSITTPQSSLKRGDWGFKRPLPLRSTTKTSTPYIRIESIDTFEHITDFGSAADHTLTLQKWEEMGVPLSTPAKPTSNSNFATESQLKGTGKSVFEDSLDMISHADGTVMRKDDVRWKFSGPWLAGLNEGEFNKYVLKEVRKRKDEFRSFLRTACATEATQAQHRSASEQGDEIPPAVQAIDVTNEQLTDYIKDLRQDRTKLNKHIRSFLDLPPSPNSRPNDYPLFDVHEFLGGKQTDLQPISESPYADSGPPKTHPSAGLAYSRTSSHLFNHPSYGPQRNKPPVQARVVMPKNAATGNFAPLLGVGGVVVNVPLGESSFDTRGAKGKRSAAQIPGLFYIEADKVGGSKAWVHPRHARIDAKGRVVLNVVTADAEAVAVQEGTVGDIPNEYKRQPSARSFGLERPSGGQGSFGYGLNRSGSSRGENRRMMREDNAALKELASFVGKQEKETAE